jgi:hypothetical protein
MDFFTQLTDEVAIAPDLLTIRLALAFVLGLLVSGVYGISCRLAGRQAETSFLTTLVLLSLLICLVTMIIGNNVAKAFSLVGTLAIVRFRTVVEDTRDTTFVIFAVACGMCAASGYLLGPIVCAPLVLGAVWLYARNRPAEQQPSDRLTMRVAATLNIDETIRPLLDVQLPGHCLLGASTARGGSVVDLTYAVKLPAPVVILELVNQIRAIDGVHEVEVKSI